VFGRFDGSYDEIKIVAIILKFEQINYKMGVKIPGESQCIHIHCEVHEI